MYEDILFPDEEIERKPESIGAILQDVMVEARYTMLEKRDEQ